MEYKIKINAVYRERDGEEEREPNAKKMYELNIVTVCVKIIITAFYAKYTQLTWIAIQKI